MRQGEASKCQARQVHARRGRASQYGTIPRQASPGDARRDMAMEGEARRASRSKARLFEVKQGQARRSKARKDEAKPGKA